MPTTVCSRAKRSKHGAGGVSPQARATLGASSPKSPVTSSRDMPRHASPALLQIEGAQDSAIHCLPVPGKRHSYTRRTQSIQHQPLLPCCPCHVDSAPKTKPLAHCLSDIVGGGPIMSWVSLEFAQSTSK